MWFATDVRFCENTADAAIVRLLSSVEEKKKNQTHDRKLLVLGGLSEISSALRVDWGLLRSNEQDRSTEPQYESVSSTRMEMGTDRLR